MKRFFHILYFACLVLSGIFFFWMTMLDWIFKEPVHMWRDVVLALASLVLAGYELLSAGSCEKGGTQ